MTASRTIGTSELEVFPLALGGNTFGWTSDEATSKAVLDAFTAAGGNFVDTADSYSAWAPGNHGGESERVIASWMKTRGNRGEIIVATKVSQHPDFGGLAPDNVAAAAEASLRRLDTDYIDLYYAHYDDESTPLDKTVGAFDTLVRAGKVRYIGVSNYSAARVQAWVDIARENNYAAPVALQPHYNLVHREPYESQLDPVAGGAGLGVVPYFALASGFLTGKYRSRDDLVGHAREGMAAGYLSDRTLEVIATLDSVAAGHETSVASVALAWLQQRPNVVAPIASARVVDQLPDLMASALVTLTPLDVASLEAVSTDLGD